MAEGLLTEQAIVEIGAVINGAHPGRTSAQEVTLFDGTGVGLQDLAVASAAVERAIETGVAIDIDF
jgi:ornithine cyclodeaminase